MLATGLRALHGINSMEKKQMGDVCLRRALHGILSMERSKWVMSVLEELCMTYFSMEKKQMGDGYLRALYGILSMKKKQMGDGCLRLCMAYFPWKRIKWVVAAPMTANPIAVVIAIMILRCSLL
jgi:hypothetical protein